MPVAQRSDGVTVASKSMSLSLNGHVGDVNSCLWLVNARASDAVFDLDLDCVFEGDELVEVLNFPPVAVRSRCSSLELLPCYFFLVLMLCWR